MEEKIDFTFAVLVYNHADYIIEHLESIKFQKLSYGENINVKLIISDDGSKDDSLKLINAWLDHNKTLFSKLVILGDGVNRGVGNSFTSMWKYIGDEPFKLLAGDDVYSYENIFLESETLSQCDFVTGLPLLLVDGKIIKSNSLILNMYATQHIYEDKSFLSKISNINVINTPSLMYKNSFIRDESTFDFIRQFRVTEDFPMMAHLASIHNKVKFITSPRVYVYYRRTSGSIYLVDSDKYNKDKEDVFKYLIDANANLVSKVILSNRLFCYKKGGFLGRLLNLSYYIYFIRLLLSLPKVISSMRKLSINERKHHEHYALIECRSEVTTKIIGGLL